MAAEKLDTEIRREQIAEAALALLGTGGIKGLNMAAVAHRLGLVSSAIYRHFKGKDEVLDAVLGLIAQRLKNNVCIVRAESTNSLDRLENLLTRHVRLIRENQAIPRIMFSDEIARGDPRRKTRLHQTICDFLGRVSEIAQEGQRNGEIRSDVEPETVAMLFVGIVQPGAVLWSLSDGQFDITRHAKRAWRLFRASVATEES
jgi:AcrR family transcriptional regulator